MAALVRWPLAPLAAVTVPVSLVRGRWWWHWFFGPLAVVLALVRWLVVGGCGEGIESAQVFVCFVVSEFVFVLELEWC